MTIIGAVDFTDAAAVIARLGARLARRLHDDLLLVHAVEPSATFSGGLLPTAVDVAPAFDAATEALRRLRDDVAALGGKVETRVVIGTPGRAVAEVAKETGATAAQVALAWVLSRDASIATIPGTRSIARLEENCAAQGVALRPEQVQRLESIIGQGVAGARY